MFYLKKGAGMARGENYEIKMLYICLHPNKKINKRFDKYLKTDFNFRYKLIIIKIAKSNMLYSELSSEERE